MSFAVLNGTWPHLGVVAAALLAACAILSRDDVLRAWSMLGAMVLACALLLADVWHSSQLGVIRRHAPEAVVGAIVVLAALAVLAHLIYRRPQLAALLTVLTLPGRIPISVGGNTSNLLLPLYFVVAASALAWLVPTLWRAHGARDLPPPARRPPRHAFEWLLAAYIVLYALQALYSVNFRTALQNEVFFYVPFAVMLALLRDLDWSRRLLLRCLGLTVVLALAFALFGFVQELTHTLILNSGLYYANQLHEYFQINSIFFDPNIFGRYLALTMVLLVALMLYDRRPRVALGAIVTLAVLWGCLIFTLSRSSLAALALGMAVLAALRWRVRPVLYLAAVVIVAGAVTLAVRPRTFGLNQGFNGASSGRASLIAGGIKMFAEKPIVGWGAGSFESEYRVQFPESARNNVPDSHDIPVTVASEQGVVGLLVYLGLVIPAIITLLRGARGDPFRVAVAATFLALLLHTLFYADFLEDPVTWTLLAIGGALAAAAQA
ncbi:MAG: O-antigen ligase family protein, partial [Solirubrobacteraceae bacterium]